MKASELRNALGYVGEDDEIEFIVSDGKAKGLMHVACPTHAEIKTEWEIPKRGDLAVVPEHDDLPRSLTIFLET
jgi:hypothetical protein